MLNTYIVYAKRTPIGNFGGQLSSIRIDDLLSVVFKDLLKNISFDAKLIDDIIVGCANQAGEDNRNIARMSALLSGLPDSVPGVTLNRLCGSSLDGVIDAACRIGAGFADCIIVGGAESMSRAPYVMSKANTAFARNQEIWDTSIGWRFPNPKMEELFPLYGMGETAEEVQNKFNISREEQDLFAFNSHQKAVKAQSENKFATEIIPVEIVGKKLTTIMTSDEGPRKDTSLEKLASLRPAFRKGGTVTAGNSSSINDGASAILIVSEKFLKEHKLTPLAQITGAGVAGLHPNVMGLGPVYATRKLCEKYNKKISDFDVVELNEAFAVQSLACIKELDLDPSKVNRNGGSIAIGHPLGCSGTRILATMINQMQNDKNVKQGLATMCIGVGQGVALSVENCL